MYEYPGDPDDIEFKTNLIKWYWSAVFSEDYSGSSDSVMAKDFRDWKVWFNNGTSIERINRIGREFVNEMDLSSVRRGIPKRMAVAYGLARPKPELEHYVLPDKVGDHTPPQLPVKEFDRDELYPK